MTGDPVLEVEDSQFGRRTVPIEAEVVRVGRHSSNDIRLSETHVSKQHAEIRRRGERFVVVDLASKAGVLVNGVRVGERALADGDLITFGSSDRPSVTFRLERPGARPATPPLPATALMQTVSLSGHGGDLEKLARFLEFSRLLGSRFDLEEILVGVVDLALDLSGAERGFLILRKPDQSLDYRVARARGKVGLPVEDARASETIVREVLHSGRKQMVGDVQDVEGLAEARSVAFLELRSAAALPLRRLSQGEVFGVLYLDSRMTQSGLGRIDHDILESLARDASSAIENANLLRLAEENRRMEEEIERARAIQSGLLPESFWQEAHFEVAGSCVPSRKLGGDYMDQFRLPGGACGLAIADVAGKGVPASLLAAALQGALGAEACREQPLEDLVGRVNRAICRRAPVGKYVTFFCCALSRDGALAFVNAGHVPPILSCARAEGVGQAPCEPLFTGDMALGIREESRYRTGSLRLRPGDVVVLYTDGVTEAIDPTGRFYGEERLRSRVEAMRDRPAGEILAGIAADVQGFARNEPPNDDITLLVFKYLGAGHDHGAGEDSGAGAGGGLEAAQGRA